MRKQNLLSLALALTFTVVGALSLSVLGQSANYERRPAMSRAEQEADEKVSFSADKIIEILRHEPGLLLQVKKTLVRKAYEQGRILDAADLSDEALASLLREDANIRVLATREIENRDYVQLKPSREELEFRRNLAEQRGVVRTLAPNPLSDQLAANSVENTRGQPAYWGKAESDWGGATGVTMSSPMWLPSSSRPIRHPLPHLFPRIRSHRVQRRARCNAPLCSRTKSPWKTSVRMPVKWHQSGRRNCPSC